VRVRSRDTCGAGRPDRERTLRTWNSSAARASDAVREDEARLRSMVGPDQKGAAGPSTVHIHNASTSLLRPTRSP